MPPYKFPEMIRLPVIVPKGARIGPRLEEQGAVVVEVNPLLFLAGAVLLFALPDPAVPRLSSGSGPSGGKRRSPARGELSGVAAGKKVKTRRLHYMYYPGQGPDHPLTAKKLSKKAAKRIIDNMRKGKVKGRLYPVFAESADMARDMIAKGEVMPFDPSLGLSGTIQNCTVWEPVWSDAADGEVWRCMMYAQSCDPGETLPPGGPIKTCAETKQVPSSHYGRMIERCARYVKSSPPKYSCLVETMPTPDQPLLKNFDKKVKDIAKSLAADANKESRTPWIAKEILSRGGIRSYKKGVEKEEYKAIPVHLRNRKGLPPDEMAAEMNMTSQELFTQIEKAYPKERAKKKRRFTWEDFANEAGAMVMAAEGGGGAYRGLGAFLPVPGMEEGPREQDLFPDLKRELVLEVQDVATSGDPLEICLQRAGWKIPRVRDLQQSIAAKAVPDMFSGKKGRLTSTEKELQSAIDRCLKRGWIQEAGFRKGAFTAQAKRAGMSVQRFADHVLSHPKKYRSRTRLRARNAKMFQRMAKGAYRA